MPPRLVSPPASHRSESMAGAPPSLPRHLRRAPEPPPPPPPGAQALDGKSVFPNTCGIKVQFSDKTSLQLKDGPTSRSLPPSPLPVVVKEGSLHSCRATVNETAPGRRFIQCPSLQNLLLESL